MPFVVELQVSGGMSITKRVIRVYQFKVTILTRLKDNMAATWVS